MTYGLGHPINDRVQCTEVDPPIYVWDSRPNPAIVVTILPTKGKGSYARVTLSRNGCAMATLIGSFPEAKLVLGEAAEDLCV